MTRRICGGRLAAAAAVAAHLIYMGDAGPASAMQILDDADHGELAAEVSATGVNRIALSHDRIRRSPGGFETEHDPETGDLYLRPAIAAVPAGSAVRGACGRERRRRVRRRGPRRDHGHPGRGGVAGGARAFGRPSRGDRDRGRRPE